MEIPSSGIYQVILIQEAILIQVSDTRRFLPTPQDSTTAPSELVRFIPIPQAATTAPAELLRFLPTPQETLTPPAD